MLWLPGLSESSTLNSSFHSSVHSFFLHSFNKPLLLRTFILIFPALLLIALSWQHSTIFSNITKKRDKHFPFSTHTDTHRCRGRGKCAIAKVFFVLSVCVDFVLFSFSCPSLALLPLSLPFSPSQSVCPFLPAFFAELLRLCYCCCCYCCCCFLCVGIHVKFLNAPFVTFCTRKHLSAHTHKLTRTVRQPFHTPRLLGRKEAILALSNCSF